MLHQFVALFPVVFAYKEIDVVIDDHLVFGLIDMDLLFKRGTEVFTF